MPDTCENWLGLANSCIHYARHTFKIYYAPPDSVDFKALGKLWNPLSKTVLSKCSYIWNKGPVKLPQGSKYVGPVNRFLFLSM